MTYDPKKIKFIYLFDFPRGNLRTGTITIAYRDSAEIENTLECSYSVCSEKDTFSRPVGRRIATARLENLSPKHTFFVEKEGNQSITQQIITHFSIEINP